MKLVRGDRLNREQRRHVLAAYMYRWTTGNVRRAEAYGTCPCCGVPGGLPEPTLRDESRMACRQHHPVIALQTDEEWLREHAFWVKKNGEMSVQRTHAEPAYMTE